MEGTPTILNVIFRKITPHKSTFLQLPNYISIHKQKSNRCMASFIELTISGVGLCWGFFCNKYNTLKIPNGIGNEALCRPPRSLGYTRSINSLTVSTVVIYLKCFVFKKITRYVGMRGNPGFPVKRALGDSIFFSIFVSSVPCVSFFSFF